MFFQELHALEEFVRRQRSGLQQRTTHLTTLSALSSVPGRRTKGRLVGLGHNIAKAHCTAGTSTKQTCEPKRLIKEHFSFSMRCQASTTSMHLDACQARKIHSMLYKELMQIDPVTASKA